MAEEHKSEVILFVFGSLMVGAFIRHLLKSSRIPYTVWLLLFGMLVGGVTLLYGESLGSITASANSLADMDPHLLMYVFLPPLIFESAYSIDSNIFLKSIFKSLILAVPALLVSVGLTGLFTATFVYPEWTWEETLLFGTIVSATDPVAVVSLLKSLGASKTLSSLIESESLLNDGTAVVIFIVLHQAVRAGGMTLGAGEILLQFSYMSFGGIFVGASLAYAVLFWISIVFNDAAVEITITLSSAYLAFYLAEATFHVSGVLSVVALGLGFSMYAATKVSPEVNHFLHEFWYMLEYLANTLVFVLTGLIIVTRNERPSAADWYGLALIYVGTTIIRTFVLFAVLPIFKRMRYGFSWQEALVCSWGGLRGAVGLALALVVKLDERIDPDRKNQMLFQVAGVVILTLVINGSTMGMLVQSLGMLKVSEVKKTMKVKAFHKLKEQMKEDIEELKRSPFYSHANWHIVREYTNLPGMEEEIELERRVTKQKTGRRRTAVAPSGPPLKHSHSVMRMEKDLWVEMRNRVLMSLKTCFYNQYEQGMIGPHALQVLLRYTSTALDHFSTHLLEWDDFQKYVDAGTHHTRSLDIPLLRRIWLNRMYSRLAFSIDVANGFRYAHETVLKLLNESHLANEFTTLQKVRRIMKAQTEKAQATLYDMYNIFPEIYVSISSRHSARMLLHNQRATVNQLNKKGLVGDREAEEWIGKIEGQMKKLIFIPSLVSLPKRNDILKEIPWIKNLSNSTFRAISSAAVPVIFSRGDYLVRQGDVGQHVLIISRGVVSIMFQYKDREIKISDVGVGSTIGEMSLLKHTCRSSSVIAQGTVLAFKLSFKDMYRIMNIERKLEANMWEHAGHHMAENLMYLVPAYKALTDVRGKLRRFIRKWELKKVVRRERCRTVSGTEVHGQFYKLDRPFMLLHGNAVQFIGDDKPKLPDDTQKIFDPVEHSRGISFKNSSAKDLTDDIFTNPIKTIKSRRSINIKPMNIAKNGAQTGPCYFPPVENHNVFFYEKSRIMLGPVEKTSLSSYVDDIRDEAMMNDQLDVLMRIPWIANSGQYAARFLLEVSEDVTFQSGHSFICTQTIADSFYIILEGFVGISAEVNGRQVIVDTKGKASSIGELAFLTHDIRNATVTAKTKVVGLRIMFRDLKTAVERYPVIEDHLWYESAVSVCQTVLHADPKYKQMDEGALKRWILKFDLTSPDESMQGDNSRVLPRMFILVFGAATISSGRNIERFAAPMIFAAPTFIPEVHKIAFNTDARVMIPKNDCTETLSHLLKNPKVRTTSSFVHHHQQTKSKSTAGDLWGLEEIRDEEEGTVGSPEKTESRKPRFSQLVSLFSRPSEGK